MILRMSTFCDGYTRGRSMIAARRLAPNTRQIKTLRPKHLPPKKMHAMPHDVKNAVNCAKKIAATADPMTMVGTTTKLRIPAGTYRL